MKKAIIPVVIVSALLATLLFARESVQEGTERSADLRALVGAALDMPEEERADSEALEMLSAELGRFFPDVRVTGLERSPVESLIQIEINRSQYVYATPDLGYLVAGDMLELREDGPVSVAEAQRSERRARIFDEGLEEDSRISFRAEDEKAGILVFTDPTCGYCQRMHRRMAEYNELGITVHYLAFPRDGGRGEITEQLNRIWCADDQHEAMNQAKLQQRITVASRECDSPVLTHLQLGQQAGVTGTPGVFDSRGRQLGGFVPPEDLARALGLD